MQVQVEDGDLHHVRVVVEAGEGVFLEEAPVGGTEMRAVDHAAPEVRGLCVMAENVQERGDEEAGGALGRIADALAPLRVH